MMIQRCIILSTLLMACVGCVDVVPMDSVASFTLENNTDRRLSFVLGKHYPDTLVPADNPIRTMNAHDSRYVDVERNMERFFESLPRDTVSIFFLDADTVKKYSREAINEEYRILERRDLSYWDLVNSKSKVLYP